VGNQRRGHLMTRWLRCDIQQVTSRLWRTYIREHDVTVEGASSKEAMAHTVARIEEITGESNPQIVWLES
jgi:hypothetical protein